jgi:hypothetical protein
MIEYDLTFKNSEGNRKCIRITEEDDRNRDDERIYLQSKIDEYILKNPGYVFSKHRKIRCTGCLEYAANQQSHMDPSGCLYDPEYL